MSFWSCIRFVRAGFFCGESLRGSFPTSSCPGRWRSGGGILRTAFSGAGGNYASWKKSHPRVPFNYRQRASFRHTDELPFWISRPPERTPASPAVAFSACLITSAESCEKVQILHVLTKGGKKKKKKKKGFSHLLLMCSCCDSHCTPAIAWLTFLFSSLAVHHVLTIWRQRNAVSYGT